MPLNQGAKMAIGNCPEIISGDDNGNKRLIGILDDKRAAEYYDPSRHAILRCSIERTDKRSSGRVLEHESVIVTICDEILLEYSMTVVEYIYDIDCERAGYDSLSAWGEFQLNRDRDESEHG